MFSFVQVLAAVLLASMAESLPFADAPDWNEAALPVLIAIPLPFLWGKTLLYFSRRGASPPWVRPLLWLFPISPLLLYSGILFLGGWASFVRAQPLPPSELLRFFLSLFPFFLLQAAQWIEARRLGSGSNLGFQVRLLLFALLPLGIYLLASDLLGQFRDLRVLLESVGLARFAATLLFVVSLIFLLPISARRLWGTSSLPAGPLRARLEELAARFEFRCRDILVWKTSGSAVNAAIVGLFPRFRYVILTDGLLGLLSPVEVEAVFGHELGHAKRHHVAIFFAFALGALLLFLLLAELALPADDLLSALALLPFLLGWWFAFGYLSRRFELEADLYGAKAVGDPELFVLALEKVGAFSGRGRWHGSWRHFSVGDRVGFLRRIQFDPEFAQTFLRRLRIWSRAGVLGFLTVFGLYAALLSQKIPLELAEFSLRRGEYSASLERLRGIERESPERNEFLRLAAEGEALRRDEPQRWRELLAIRGRDSFLRRDFVRAADLLTLAFLLDEGGTAAANLARAAAYLAERDRAGLQKFLENEGAELLRDPQISGILYSK